MWGAGLPDWYAECRRSGLSGGPVGSRQQGPPGSMGWGGGETQAWLQGCGGWKRPGAGGSAKV